MGRIPKELMEFINSVEWTFAKTYAKTAPHEYVVKDKLASEEMKRVFESFVIFIREHGYRAEFWGTTHTYLDVDGKKYWTMGEPLEETDIINRSEI